MSAIDADVAAVQKLQMRSGQLLADLQKGRRARGESELSGEDERQAGRQFIQQAIAEHRAALVDAGEQPPAWEAEEQLALAIESRQFGAGSLQHLIDDEDIENIDINGFDQVFVTDKDGLRRRVDPVAQSDDELIKQVQTLAAYAGLSSRPFDVANPELDLRLPDGSRLSAIQGVTPRPSVSIRRHRFMKVGLADLVGTGTMSTEIAEFLAAAVRARLNIMISGATNAGKTTLLRALAAEIDTDDRVVTVERALELGFSHDPEAHPNLVELEERLPNSEGQGAISLLRLVRRTLRMNPDRVIVGEVLGPEIVTMLNAMSQGNEGSLSTIHARSGRSTFDRIAVYAKQAAEGLDLEASAQLVASGLDLVVFVKKVEDDGRGGARRAVREILEVNGFDGPRVSASAIYTDEGAGAAVRNVNAFLSGARAEALARAGWSDVDGSGWVA
ncbi:type II secretion system protein E [Aeromicrobium sp. Root495]|uniref:CpaF family protein n=1 Tax=Aeromicrobium sp. Root495 TaxID=1736550 RepID=UPI0006FF7D7B|nr:ATPase, T2SS/T4P/T4SS family [Aeromicrobium sp. Root495]KQY55750.1 type II secretion system protein E [Aeromicrobium sp. Root495]